MLPPHRRVAEERPRSLEPRLQEAVELFNHRQFFQCHDVVEPLWLQTHGPARDFYRGFIQAAIAYYHWSRGNPRGALSLYRSSRRYLERYRPTFLGLDVANFLTRHTELFDWLRRHRLRYDARLVPVLRWVTPVSE